MSKRLESAFPAVLGGILGLGFPAGSLAEHIRQFDVPGASVFDVEKVNARGDIAGHFQDPLVSYSSHGFLLTERGFTTIDVPGATATAAWGVNERGDIAGAYTDSTLASRGFLLRHGEYTNIGPPGAVTSAAYGINTSGEIAGGFVSDLSGAPNSAHGFVLTKGEYVTIDMPGATEGTTAMGINAAGDTVGTYTDSTGVHGFLLRKGEFTTIDVPGASATNAMDINDRGEIAGSWYNASSERWFEFVLTLSRSDSSGGQRPNYQITVFDVPGAIDTRVGGISPQGNLAGTIRTETGFHGYLLTK